MMLAPESIKSIESTIRDSLKKKFQNYKPESKHMPFHFRLLGKDRMALYSFIHSLNTSFGTSIFEPVAVTLSKTRFAHAESQHPPGNQISEEAQRVIQNIINDLGSACKSANKTEEIERIRTVCQKGVMNTIRTVNVDLFIKESNGAMYLFDIKTVKPNLSGFKDHKRTLLEWCAIKLAQNPAAEIISCIAIPYNPYEPEPYQRWTLKGMLDLEHELKVAGEFWDFLGGNDSYEAVLDCFERVGIDLRDEVNRYFEKFNT